MNAPDYAEKDWPVIRNALVGILEQKRPHTNYGIGEADATHLLAALKRCQKAVGMAVSLHSFMVSSLARAAVENPEVLTYRRGNKLITFKNADVVTLLEKRISPQARIPVGYTFREANLKSVAEINWELRQAGKSDLTDDPAVQTRRRLAKLPTPLRRYFFRRMVSDPFRYREIFGNIGLTNLQTQGYHQPYYPLPVTFGTLTIALGGVSNQFRPDENGQPALRKILCVGLAANHEVIDGMGVAKFCRRFAQLIESAEGLDDRFIEETLKLKETAP